GLQVRVAALLHNADVLMAGRAGRQGVLLLRQRAVVEPEVAAADGEVLHLDQRLAVLRRGHVDVLEREPAGTNQTSSLHRNTFLSAGDTEAGSRASASG